MKDETWKNIKFGFKCAALVVCTLSVSMVGGGAAAALAAKFLVSSKAASVVAFLGAVPGQIMGHRLSHALGFNAARPSEYATTSKENAFTALILSGAMAATFGIVCGEIFTPETYKLSATAIAGLVTSAFLSAGANLTGYRVGREDGGRAKWNLLSREAREMLPLPKHAHP